MIGDRLSELRRDAGMTQPEFAAIAGTSKQYLGRLEKGLNKDPNPKLIERWARHFRVRMEWITTGKLPKEAPADASTDSDWGDVLAYSQAAGLGTSGPEAQEYASTNKLKFRKDSLARKRLNPENLRVMYGDGDSMEPRIQAHDAILFDISDTTPKQNGIYVLLTPGAGAEEYNVKRCLMSGGRAYFVADNLEGDHDWKAPRAMDDPNYPIKIVGRVKWIGGWVP